MEPSSFCSMLIGVAKPVVGAPCPVTEQSLWAGIAADIHNHGRCKSTSGALACHTCVTEGVFAEQDKPRAAGKMFSIHR